MSAASGFRNAPVSQGILFATAGASVVAQAAKASHRAPPHALQMASHTVVLRSPAELVFGALLIYCFRVLERQSGSSKFGAFALTSWIASTALQWALNKSLHSRPLPSGPYGLIFSCFVQYFFTIPASSRIAVLGWRLSDKVFMYMAGLQLLLSGGVPTLLAGGSGIVAGLLYRFNFLGLKRLRVPAVVSRILAATVGRLLGASTSSNAVGGAPTGQQPGATTSRQRQRRQAGAAAPSAQPQQQAASALPEPLPEAVEQLVAMGFNEAEATRALRLANNDVQQAISLLL